MSDVPRIARDARLLAPKRPGTFNAKVALLCGTTLASLGVLAPPRLAAHPPQGPAIITISRPTASVAAPLVLSALPRLYPGYVGEYVGVTIRQPAAAFFDYLSIIDAANDEIDQITGLKDLRRGHIAAALMAGAR